MSTPKNQNQAKSAASTVKKAPVKGLRNILAHPHEIIWPILRGDSGDDLKVLLSELLPEQKCSTKSVPWAHLWKLSKDERTALKKKNQEENMTVKDTSVMNELVLGINAVTRGMEKNTIRSILVDSGLDPLSMVKHIVTMGEKKDVPVLLVPFLKLLTLEKIGFASAAVGLKKIIESKEDSHFHKLHEKILILAMEFLKKGTSLNFEDSMMSEEESDDEEIPLEKIPKPVIPVKVSTNVYKYRSTRKERAFIPPNSRTEKCPVVEEKNSFGDFISVMCDDAFVPEPKSQKKGFERFFGTLESEKMDTDDEATPDTENTESIRHSKSEVNGENLRPIYRPLKVKRMQGNPKRSKATKTPKSLKKTAVNKK